VSGTHLITVGNKGRVVLPAPVRAAHGLVEGAHLVVLDSPSGIVLLTRDQLKLRVRHELAGLDLVADLLADRRAASAADDAP